MPITPDLNLDAAADDPEAYANGGLNGGGAEAEAPADDENDDQAEQPVVAEDEGEPENEEAGAPEEQQPNKPSRASARIQELDRRAKEANDRAEKVERELAEIRRANDDRRKREDEEREQAVMDAMDPYERQQYQTRKDTESLRSELQALRLQTAEAQDKAEFASKFSIHPYYKRLAGKLDEEIGKARKAGNYVDRRSVFAYLVGQEVLERGPRAAGDQRRQGRQAVAAATGASTRARGDASAVSRGRSDDLESRLDGVHI